jgi:hypothetical protein
MRAIFLRAMKLLLSFFLFERAEDRRREAGGALDRDEESGNRLACWQNTPF